MPLTRLLINKPQASGQSPFRVGLSILTLGILPLLQLQIPSSLVYGPLMYLMRWHILCTGPPVNDMRFGSASLSTVACVFLTLERLYINIHNGNCRIELRNIGFCRGMSAELKLYLAVILSAFLFTSAHRPSVGEKN